MVCRTVNLLKSYDSSVWDPDKNTSHCTSGVFPLLASCSKLQNHCDSIVEYVNSWATVWFLNEYLSMIPKGIFSLIPLELL